MSEKGLSGLTNLGNTCYLNSVLQILSHTYELNEIINNPKLKINATICDNIIINEWKALHNLLWDKNCVISPNRFVKSLQMLSLSKKNLLFANNYQNDLPEFLFFLFDCFHKSLSREINISIKGDIKNETDSVAMKCYDMIKVLYSKDYSEIWYNFYGMQVNELKSVNEDKIVSQIPEPFFILSLAIPDKINVSLIDCFNMFTKSEILEEDNMWLNEATNEKEKVTKRNMFWSLPDILIIDLKRYDNKSKKKKQLVDFPFDNLDLSPYVIGYNKSSYIYDLYAVCDHTGGTLGGHYTSNVKTKNNNWYNFNDTVVTHLDTVSAISKIISPKAYCLFYRKQR